MRLIPAALLVLPTLVWAAQPVQIQEVDPEA